MTVGDVEQQPLTALDEPGGDTLRPRPSRPATASRRPASLDGPFTTRQLLRLDEALRIADQQTGLTFSVYVGELEVPTRASAEKLHKQIEDADRAVLIAVSPNQRRLEIVTGNERPQADLRPGRQAGRAVHGGRVRRR